MTKTMREWLATAGVLYLGSLVLTVCLSGTAASAAEEGETWQYQCLGDEVVGDKICTTELATFHGGDEFIVYFVHVKKGKPPLVISGENENISEITVVVDKNSPLSSQDCEDAACFFDAAASGTLMKQFRKGFRVKVRIGIGGGEVIFDRVLSLRGFSAALTAPPG